MGARSLDTQDGVDTGEPVGDGVSLGPGNPPPGTRPTPGEPNPTVGLRGREGAKRGYKPAGKLDDRTALVLGGDSTMGRAVSTMYGREGANVVVVCSACGEDGRDGQKRDDQKIVEHASRRSLLLRGEVTDPAFCKAAVDRVVRELGGIDVLVTNASFPHHPGDGAHLADGDSDHVFGAHVYGYLHMIKACLPHMKAGSAIVMTGSEQAPQGAASLVDRSAMLGAVTGFTQSLASKLVDRGIRVNTIIIVPNEAALSVRGDHAASSTAKAPPTPAPEDVAPAYVFLAADPDSRFITGQVLTVTGSVSL